MSYEGYEIYLCEQGHRWTRDVYAPERPNCPHCEGAPVWQCSIDQTNGHPGEPKPEIAEAAPTCPECHQSTGPVRYVVPEHNVSMVGGEEEEEDELSGIECLIEALSILSFYDDEREQHPTNCDHDIFRVFVSRGDEVSPEDVERLSKLGFRWDGDDLRCWYSYRFGSN